MSKTYTHQKQYRYKNYYRLWFITSRRANGSPEPKDINEPVGFFPYYNRRDLAYWNKISYKRLRQKAKRLLAKGDYDNIPRKPEDMTWCVW